MRLLQLGGGGSRRRSRTGVRLRVFVAMVFASLAGSAVFIAPAGATLSGSTFDTTNGDLTNLLGLHDWNPAGSPSASNIGPIQTITCPATAPGAGTNCGLDRTNSSLDDSFTQGPKEDDVAPVVGDGSIPPNKDDLSRFYVNQEKGANGKDYLYLAWERTNTLGSAHMDFEFNQSSTASSNGVTKLRTAGDMLITFDFGGSGAPVLSLSRWVTTGAATQCEANNTVPCWGKLVALTGVADGSVNSKDVTDYNPPGAPRTLAGNIDSKGTTDSTFGEAGINLTDANVFPQNVCAHFGAAMLKSRSSGQSFTSSLKDFIAPIPVNISNCGGLAVQKYIDVNENGAQNTGERSLTGDGGQVVDNDLAGWSFTVTGPNSFSCTGTTDASGVLTSCLKADNTAADLAALPAGSYTVTENANAGKTIGSSPGAPFFNTDPGPIPTAPPVSATASVAVDGTATVDFGNSCYAKANFSVTGVPSSQSGLFVIYTVNTDLTEHTVNLSQSGSTWSGSTSNTLRRGDVIHWKFGSTADPNHFQTAQDFTLSGYPSCAGSGSVQFQTATVNGVKYKDINGNGARDIGEGGLAGFQFQLKSGSTVLDTQRSSGSGAIQFQNVAAGTYTIHEVGPPSGWVQTEPANGADVTVTVHLDDTSVTASPFGNTPLSNVSVTFNSLASLYDASGNATGPATKATSINCSDANGDVGSSTNSNTNTTNNLQIKQSSVTCVITFTDP